MWGNIHFLNDETLDEVIDQDKVSIVFFFLADNIECRKEASIVRDLAAEFGERYNFVVLDAAECPQAVHRFGVTDVPAAVFVRRGIGIGGYNGLIKQKHLPELVERLAFMQAEPLESQFPGCPLDEL